MKLQDKVAIITGSSKGIGRAIALDFAREGAKVVVNSRHREEAEKVAREIKAMGKVALAVQADVSKENEVKKLVKKTVDAFGRVDILVNNAGVARFSPLTSISEKQWKFTIGTNLTGQFLCAKEVTEDILKRKAKGVIINIASIAGEIGFKNLAPYCAAKGGIIELTRELALELAPNIRVNAIGPGVIETDMTSDLLKNQQARNTLLQQIPMGRFGQPEDISKVAVLLASDESSYMTGHTIFIDGGWLTQ